MTIKSAVARLTAIERINFLLTNRIPRRALTLLIGWFSKIEHPWVRDFSIATWRWFSDLDLSEAKQSRFRSMHDCFTRELKAHARPVNADPRVVTSPSDAVVGACGDIRDISLIQAKGFPYTLSELLHDPRLVETYRDGKYITLRLTASMYHRFHAPYDCRVRRITYIAGDTWNVNPIALKRIERLFCKNERAVIPCELQHAGAGVTLTLVPVAAILVASIRLHFADVLLHLRYGGPSNIVCSAQLGKGEEMGWFQHGSTIIVFAPRGLALHPSIVDGASIKAGSPLLMLPPSEVHPPLGLTASLAQVASTRP